MPFVKDGNKNVFTVKVLIDPDDLLGVFQVDIYSYDGSVSLKSATVAINTSASAYNVYTLSIDINSLVEGTEYMLKLGINGTNTVAYNFKGLISRFE